MVNCHWSLVIGKSIDVSRKSYGILCFTETTWLVKEIIINFGLLRIQLKHGHGQ